MPANITAHTFDIAELLEHDFSAYNMHQFEPQIHMYDRNSVVQGWDSGIWLEFTGIFIAACEC